MLTTHDLGDIEDVCRRIVIIDGGRIIYDGAIADVKDGFARQRQLHVQFTGEPGDPEARPTLSTVTTLLPDAEVIEGLAPGDFTIRFDRFTLTAAQVIAALLPLGEIADFRLDEPSIEDVIRKVYAGDLQLAPS
jgi:ABC-2 type transport system ATP-binding protein